MARRRHRRPAELDARLHPGFGVQVDGRKAAQGAALKYRPSTPSLRRKRAPLYFDGAEHPETPARSFLAVIPANAGSALLRR
ncbi:hypothetical protein [Lysobacter gummosus]|uniref:hypothetical protein n=1 Tax=Lysobacter gummosus TaxID=262324 RepID=UPI0036446186